MKVLFLQQQPCVRTLKYATALGAAEPGIVLGFACQGATLTEWYGRGDELFERWWRLPPDAGGDLGRIVDEFCPDVVHSHNLPDELTVMAIEATSGRVPVIHDAHDLQSLRRTPYEAGFPEPADPLSLERRAVEESNAVVAVSPEMLEQILARHRPTGHTFVFANYALAQDLPASLPPPERAAGEPVRIVYQGTLSVNAGHYDLRDIFTAVVAQGATLDIYPGRPAPAYQQLAASHPRIRCHDTLPPHRLLEVLPQYDLGWAGFNATLNGAHLDTALPNKVFEYIGCGLPVVTLGHRAITRLVEDEGVGISLAAVEDLGTRLGEIDHVALRRRVAAVRPAFTVEAHIGRLAELYRSVA
jgi:glycosyltransferase involved in cell wall biosynthesis